MIEATCAACGTVARIAEADVPTGAKFVTCASCKARVALPQKAATPAAGVKSIAIPNIKPPPIPGPAKGKGDTLDLADLPAPKRTSPLAGASGPARPVPSPLSGVDLPAPKSAKPPAPSPGALDLDDLMPAELPVPKGKSDGGVADLPAPKPRPSPLAGAELPATKAKPPSPLGDLPSGKASTSPLADLPLPKGKIEVTADLPAPKAKTSDIADSKAKTKELGDLPLPKGKIEVTADLPAPKAKPGVTDLPTPKVKPGLADLPTPKKQGPAAAAPTSGGIDDELDLPMPKPGANNDLPAPKGFFDDLPQPAKQQRDGGGGSIDLPAPKGFFDDLPQPARGGAARPGQEVAPKGFFEDLPQVAKGGASRPGQEVAPKGFFDDLPQPAKGGGQSTDVAPKGFFDDLPQPAKGGKGGPGIFDDLPQPTKGAASAGLFDDLPQPSRSADDIPLSGSDMELSGERPLELDGGGSPDLDLGLPLGEAGGFQDLDLGEPTAKSRRSAEPEEPASPIKIKTPGKGGPAAKPIQITVPKDPKAPVGDLKLDLAEDPQAGAPAAAKGGTALKKAGAKKQSPEEIAALRAAKRRRTRIALGTVLGLAALGAGGFVMYQRHTKEAARRADIKSNIDAARAALVAETPTHWNIARAKAEEAIQLDPTNTVALGLASEAAFAGALDTGINGPVRIVAGRKFMQDGLGAGKATTELERAQALSYIAGNQPDKAIPRLKTLIGQVPGDGWLQVYLGWAELSLGDANEALKAFDQAVAKTKATKMPALYGQGRAYLMLADIEHARSAFSTILQSVKANAPESVCATVQLSATLPPSQSAQRDVELKAILNRDDVTKKLVDPRCITQVYTLLGDVARDNGRLDIARENYRKALALTAGDVSAQVGIARVEMRDKRLPQAADALTKALATNANDPRANLANAELMVMQGKLPDADKAIEKLSARKPPLTPLDQAQLDVVKGKLLEAQGKPEDAVDAYAAGAKLAGELDLTPTMAAVRLLTNLANKSPDPAKADQYKARAKDLLSVLAARAQEDAQLSTQLGVAYLQAGDANTAETFLRRAVELREDDPEAKLELGKVYEALGRTDDALVQIKAAIAIDNKRTDFRLELAVTYQNAGRDDEAIKAYGELLALPDVPQIVRINAGRFFLKKGLLDRDNDLIKKGAAQSEPILKEEPENAAGLYLKGEGLMLDKKYDEAGPILTKACDTDPQAQYLDALGRDFEARIPTDTKFIESARNAYERASNADPKFVHPLLGQGAMLVLKLHHKDALAPLIAAHNLDRNNSEIDFWTGRAYYGLRNEGKDAVNAKTSAQWFEAALNGQPELPLEIRAEATWRLGDLYDAHVNNAKKAAESWELATKLGEQVEKEKGTTPDWLVETYYSLGDEYRKMDNPAATAAAFKKYVARPPTKETQHFRDAQQSLLTTLQRYR